MKRAGDIATTLPYPSSPDAMGAVQEFLSWCVLWRIRLFGVMLVARNSHGAVMMSGNGANTEVQKQNVGNAGEYYLAARLSALDFIATITLGRAERYDIIAVAPSGKTVKISVKARRMGDVDHFTLGAKDETGGADDFFYAFVRLNEFGSLPDVWIVPSRRVNEIVHHDHRAWLSGNKRSGEKRKDSSLRNFNISLNESLETRYPRNWHEEIARYKENFAQLG